MAMIGVSKVAQDIVCGNARDTCGASGQFRQIFFVMDELRNK
jgi:hypothetical protein